MKQEKEYYINNSTVRIRFGSILESYAEVIVNNSDTMMSMDYGISKAIWETGGEIIREDAQMKLPVNLGDVIVTTAGSLPQKYIFHCVSQEESFGYNNTPKQVSEEDILQYIAEKSLDKCFLLMHAMELRSIAFPAIEVSKAGGSFYKVATIMAETIGKNLRKTNKALHVEIFLHDSDGMDTWAFLPMFEQFSAQEALSKLLREQMMSHLSVEESPIIEKGIEISPYYDQEVFICYSRNDFAIVSSIYEHLENSGINCWLDIDDVFNGVSFKKVVLDAIKQVKLVLFVSSEDSNKSRNVVNEVSVALEHGKKIIPIRLDMSPYAEIIGYDLVNHDYVVYNKSHIEDSFNELLKKIVSTLKML